MKATQARKINLTFFFVELIIKSEKNSMPDEKDSKQNHHSRAHSE